MEILLHSILTAISFFLFLAFVKFLEKLWWNPVRKQSISCSHRALEARLTNSSVEMPKKYLGISEPHIHSWINVYGKSNQPLAFIVLHLLRNSFIRQMLNKKDVSFWRFESEKYLKKKQAMCKYQNYSVSLMISKSRCFHPYDLINLASLTPTCINLTEMMLRKYKSNDGKETEVCEEFRMLTSEVISGTAFGSSYEEGQQLFQMSRQLTFICCRNMEKIRFPDIRYVYLMGSINLVYKSLERQKLLLGLDAEQYLQEKAQLQVSDFLGLLLEAHHDAEVHEYKRILAEEIIDECKTFYSAGQGTTTILLSWTIFLLAMHKNWQDKVREEVNELIGDELQIQGDFKD
ncbi:unnamed protein product [Coffea canephora]|uniref:Cytochrome P450 n=1 Tax=Coffea canephora TaxID=49390 RepID=A0A068TW25_COFCA|nr:unnamed protein product [Coffea canephora]